MNNFLFFLFISLSLPMISPAQETDVTAEDAFKKGLEYEAIRQYTKAVQWYQIAADLGYADAQYLLGNKYYKGEGVHKDLIKAFEWYTKAAGQEDVFAQDALAQMYELSRNEGVYLCNSILMLTEHREAWIVPIVSLFRNLASIIVLGNDFFRKSLGISKEDCIFAA